MEPHIRPLAWHLGACAVAFTLLAGCRGNTALPAPTPSPPAPPAPIPSGPIPPGPFTVSGVVFEVVSDAMVPLEGARVEDSTRHFQVTTGGDGSYTIHDVAGGVAYLYISKGGFRSESRQFILAADTQLDIQLRRQ